MRYVALSLLISRLRLLLYEIPGYCGCMYCMYIASLQSLDNDTPHYSPRSAILESHQLVCHFRQSRIYARLSDSLPVFLTAAVL